MEMPQQYSLFGNAHLNCPGISRSADDWAIVSISALSGVSANTLCSKDPPHDLFQIF